MISHPADLLESLPRDKRAAIRDLVGAHFDDAGYYLDGYSDERIALECDVPRAVVSHMRDTGWGKEQVRPEIAALMGRLDKVERETADIKASLQKLTGER